MTWRELTVEQFNDLKHKVVIDVRSPCEHAKENIPHSANVPLLSDEERCLVGTIYAEHGEAIARRHAVNLIAPKIPAIIDRIVELKTPGHALVVHCWRGGLRSEAVVSFLSIVGIDSFRLAGGYKAWRRAVVKDFEHDFYRFQLFVLDGLTGSGKTAVLKELRNLDHPVVDLEELANHRGSVFGGIGLGAQPSQKNFEGMLWLQLRHIEGAYAFAEAESRKIGKIALPTFLLNKIKNGRKILVQSSLQNRCNRLISEYSGKLDSETMRTAISCLSPLKERLGTEQLLQLTNLIQAQQLEKFVTMLLLEYYDPMYSKGLAQKEPFDFIVSGDDVAKAAKEITAWTKQIEPLSSTKTTT